MAAKKKPLQPSPIYIERRDDGSYVGRKATSKRASFVEETQGAAIERAREMGGTPLVERQRNTKNGGPDQWRRA